MPIITKDGHELWIGQNMQLIMEDDHVTGCQQWPATSQSASG